MGANRLGRAAIAAAAVILCVPMLWARGEHTGGSQAGARVQRRVSMSTRQRRGNVGQPSPGRPYPGPPYFASGASRPAYSGYRLPTETPRGHLGDWLNQHRNLPVQQQEQMLRSDPSFRRLPPGEQQRVVQQLRQVDQLTPQEQQRRAARVEMLEKLSPQEQMQINLSARRWGTLPVDRQALMKNAFRDLRAVPPEQRPTVLDSAGFQAAFSPEERGILSDMLRVEPYQPAR